MVKMESDKIIEVAFAHGRALGGLCELDLAATWLRLHGHISYDTAEKRCGAAILLLRLLERECVCVSVCVVSARSPNQKVNVAGRHEWEAITPAAVSSSENDAARRQPWGRGTASYGISPPWKESNRSVSTTSRTPITSWLNRVPSQSASCWKIFSSVNAIFFSVCTHPRSCCGTTPYTHTGMNVSRHDCEEDGSILLLWPRCVSPPHTMTPLSCEVDRVDTNANCCLKTIKLCQVWSSACRPFPSE